MLHRRLPSRPSLGPRPFCGLRRSFALASFALALSVGSYGSALASTCHHPEGNLEVALWGDVNESGHVNVADVVCVLAVALAELSEDPAPTCLAGPPALADLNCDGVRNVSDAQLAVTLAIGGGLFPSIPMDAHGCPVACAPCADAGSSSCLIEGSCVPEGEVAGPLSCDACVPAIDPAGWSPAVDQTPCSDSGHVCVGGECVPGSPPPTDVVATPLDAAASVAFAPPAGGPAVLSYEVEATPSEAISTAASSPGAVGGLTNGVSYTFRVRAITTEGPSPWSEPSEPVTPMVCLGQPNGTPCSDGDLCTTGDTCQSESCVAGAPVDCGPASSDCMTAPQCDAATGECQSSPLADGEPCVDASACAGQCNAGQCFGFDAVAALPGGTQCATTATLEATLPSGASGAWTLQSGSGTVTSPSSPTSGVTGLGFGANVFRWTVTGDVCGDDFVEVTITRPEVTGADAGAPQGVCEVTTASLSAVPPVVGSGSWSVQSGTATVTDPSDPQSAVTGLGYGDAVLRWTVDGGECGTAFGDVVVTRYAPPSAPDAGAAQSVCEATTTLAAVAPAVGAGAWSVALGSGTFADEGDPSSAVSGLAVGENTLRWTVTSGVCEPVHADVIVERGLPPTAANTSADKHVCGYSTSIGANTPASGTGSWSVVSGTGSFADASSASTTVSDLSLGANVLRWTVETDFCGSSTDDLALDVYEPPTTADAGPDQNLPPAQEHATLNANAPLVGAGVWTVIEGNGVLDDPTDPQTGVTGLDQGLNVFRWTISNGPCSSWAEVAIIRPMTCEGHQNITTPADVKTLRVCLTITGNLIATNVSAMADFEWMVNLEEIHGNFNVQNNGQLQDFTGLSALRSIGGDFTIRTNHQLQSFAGLQALEEVGGDFTVRWNNQLADSGGLVSLEQVDGSLWIGHNPQLQDLTGLSALSTVGEDLRVDDHVSLVALGLSALQGIGRDLVVTHNEALSQCAALALAAQVSPLIGGATIVDHNAEDGSCGPLEAGDPVCDRSFLVMTRGDVQRLGLCTSVTGNVDIYTDELPSNQRPDSLQPLQGLAQIGGYLRIRNSSALTDLAGLDQLLHVGGYLYLQSLPILEDVTALNALQHVEGYLYIYNCNRVRPENGAFASLHTIGGYFRWNFNSNPVSHPVHFDAFPNLVTIGGDLYMYSSNTESISGFGSLQSVGGYIRFQTLGRATTLPTFPQLQTMGSHIWIENCNAIETWGGLPALTTVPQYVRVANNDALTTVTALPNVQSLGNGLAVEDNAALQQLSGFSSLEQIGSHTSHNLSIAGNPALTSVAGLGSLVDVSGSLVVRENAALTTLAPLGAVARVGSQLRIEENEALTTLGLAALGTTDANSGVGGTFTIFGNPSLPQCDAVALRDQILNGPGSIGGNVTIIENEFDPLCPGAVPPVENCNVNHVITSAVDLLALQTCTTSGGITVNGTNVSTLAGVENIVTINGNISVQNNPNLASMAAFQSLDEVTGSVTISSNPELTLLGLSELTSIGSFLRMQSNSTLPALTGLEKLESIGGYLFIQSNSALQHIQALSSLTSLGTTTGSNLKIRSNNSLQGLQGLEGLTSVAGYVYVQSNSNAQFTNLEGLDNITSIGGYLYVYNMNSLTSLAGLESLEEIGGHLYIRGNNSLQSLSGLESVHTVGNYVRIWSNNSLQSLDGLEALTSIGFQGPNNDNSGYLWIHVNPQLQHVDGLSALEDVAGYVHIHDNNQLTSLTGLGSLRSVNRVQLRVEANPQLQVLGFGSLELVDGNFVIFNNQSLPECEAYAIADAVGEGILGVITVGNNDTTASCP